MFITRVLGFSTTLPNLAKKAKSKDILVCLESIVSGHRINLIRPRLDDKMEIVRFDPWIRMPSIYKEKKKVRSL